jgi:hypothetical protein
VHVLWTYPLVSRFLCPVQFKGSDSLCFFMAQKLLKADCEKSHSDSVLVPLRFPLCIVRGDSPTYVGLSGISLPWHIINGRCARRHNYPFIHTLLLAGPLFPMGKVGSCHPWPSDFRSICPGNIHTTCLNFSKLFPTISDISVGVYSPYYRKFPVINVKCP